MEKRKQESQAWGSPHNTESASVELAGIPEKGRVIFQGVLMPGRFESARDVTHQSFRSLPQVPTQARCLVPGH